jgi:hypothetical protein
MNKIAWEESKCPFEMMVALLQRFPAQDTKLKLIFFATSCCYNLLNFLSDERSKKVVEFMAGYEDTRVWKKKLLEVRSDALAVLQEKGIDWKSDILHCQQGLAEIAVYHLTSFVTVADAVTYCARAIANDDNINVKKEYSEQTVLLRKIFGNPFQGHKETTRVKLR